MNIKEEQQQDIVIITPTGRIDSFSSPTLESKLQALLDDNIRKLMLDFTTVEYISSAGLRVVLKVAKRLRAAGSGFALCQLNDNILKVFQMGGFNKILTIVETRDQALVKLQ